MYIYIYTHTHIYIYIYIYVYIYIYIYSSVYEVIVHCCTASPPCRRKHRHQLDCWRSEARLVGQPRLHTKSLRWSHATLAPVKCGLVSTSIYSYKEVNEHRTVQSKVPRRQSPTHVFCNALPKLLERHTHTLGEACPWLDLRGQSASQMFIL